MGERDDGAETLGWEELGRDLRQLRQTRQGREGRPGMSQKALATRFGFTPAVIVLAEQGKRVSAQIADLYDAFYDTGGAISARRDALVAARARRKGKDKGWLTASTPVAVREGDDGFRAFGWWLRKLRGGMRQETLAAGLGVSQSAVSLAEKGVQLTARTAARYDNYFSARGTTAKGEISARWYAVADARERAEEESRHASPPPGTAPGQALTLPGHPATLVDAGGGLVAAPQLEQLTGLPSGRSLALPDGPYRVIASTGEVVIVAIDRRLFVAGASMAVPLAGMEQTRHTLLGSLAADPADAHADEWRQIAWEYGLSYMSTPSAELLGSLQVDLAALGEALQRQHADPAKRELHKVAALLAAVAARAVANLGDLRSSRRWWRTAKQAADTSGDIQTRLWIRGGEVTEALHEPRSVPAIFDLIAESEAISAGANAPAAALPGLLAGKAQTLAIAGQATQAETALYEAQDNFNRLPAHIVGDTESLFGWSERALRFTEGYVYSHMGDLTRAEQAQTAALALYPSTFPRGPVVIELQRAFCLVRAGDITSGVEHAHAVLTGLPREQYIRPIVDSGRKVLDAVPATERNRDGVQKFRAYLDHEVA